MSEILLLDRRRGVGGPIGKPLEMVETVPPLSLRLTSLSRTPSSRNIHQERAVSCVRLRITYTSQCWWSDQNVLPLGWILWGSLWGYHTCVSYSRTISRRELRMDRRGGIASSAARAPPSARTTRSPHG